ncbi:MAG TPA: peptidase domain-containing ABC transporter [Enteractinococcus sp.]
MSRVPTVLQTAETDCGPACLTAMLRAHGHRVKLIDLRTDMDPGRDGSSGVVMRQTGQRWGLPLQAQLVDPHELSQRIHEIPLPFILHLTRQHYVVVDKIRGDRIEVMDPAVGRRRFSRFQITEETSGLVLFLGAAETVDDEPPVLAPRAHTPGVLAAVLRGVRGELARAGLLSALLAVGGLTLPVTTALIVDALVSQNVDQHRWLAVGMTLAVTVGTLTLARNWVLATLQRRMAGQLSTEVAATLFSRHLKFFDRRSVGDLFGRVESAHAIHALLSVALLGAGLDALLTIGYLIALLVIAPPLAAVTGVFVVVALSISGIIAHRSASLRREEILVTADSSTVLVDGIDGITTLRAYGAETQMLERWSALLDRRLQLTRSRARLNAISTALLAATGVAAPLVILVLAASPVVAASSAIGDITPGTALGFMALASATLAPVASLATQLVEAADLRPLLDRVHDLTLAEPERCQGMDPGRLTGAITLRNLRFQHERYGREILRGLNAHVPAGSTVCILGPTGCGKTTLAHLIAGMHSPSQGQILVDDQDVATLNLEAVRAQIGVVFQDAWAPSGTIREAIVVSREGYTDDDIWRALSHAQLAEDILALPMGLNTRLGSGGSGLSGGQRQRLALARALLGNPKILILDEPTSALDGDTERAIEAALVKLNITRIIVTHRLSIAAAADQLWIMHDGELVESGTPADLAHSGGWYSQLLDAQSVSSQKLSMNTALG